MVRKDGRICFPALDHYCPSFSVLRALYSGGSALGWPLDNPSRPVGNGSSDQLEIRKLPGSWLWSSPVQVWGPAQSHWSHLYSHPRAPSLCRFLEQRIPSREAQKWKDHQNSGMLWKNTNSKTTALILFFLKSWWLIDFWNKRCGVFTFIKKNVGFFASQFFFKG